VDFAASRELPLNTQDASTSDHNGKSLSDFWWPQRDDGTPPIKNCCGACTLLHSEGLLALEWSRVSGARSCFSFYEGQPYMRAGGSPARRQRMMRRTRTKSWLAALAALGCILTATPALADSINPLSIAAVIPVGGSVTVTKSVTVNAGTPTTAQGDVFFLTDATGSMAGRLATCRTMRPPSSRVCPVYGNIQTGAGSYRDFNEAHGR